LSLFGIKEGTGQLFWDGKQVRTRSLLLLGTPERWIAGFAAARAFGTFLVNLTRLVLEKVGLSKKVTRKAFWRRARQHAPLLPGRYLDARSAR
jgi:hypothetical protein